MCKVLCDNHAGCPSNGQNWASMSLWISSHKRCNINVRTCDERLVTAKGYLKICWTFHVSSEDGD